VGSHCAYSPQVPKNLAKTVVCGVVWCGKNVPTFQKKPLSLSRCRWQMRQQFPLKHGHAYIKPYITAYKIAGLRMFVWDLFNHTLSTPSNNSFISATFQQNITRKHLWTNLFIWHLPGGTEENNKSHSQWSVCTRKWTWDHPYNKVVMTHSIAKFSARNVGITLLKSTDYTYDSNWARGGLWRRSY
jgi:hypothetical protein